MSLYRVRFLGYPPTTSSRHSWRPPHSLRLDLSVCSQLLPSAHPNHFLTFYARQKLSPAGLASKPFPVPIAATALVHTAWEDAYGLSSPSLLPPSPLVLPAHVPEAPHLVDCAAGVSLRERTEADEEGMAAPWTGVDGCDARPAWVRGPSSASAPMTRRVQADIWRHQFPPGPCDTHRLLLVDWRLLRSMPSSSPAGTGGADWDARGSAGAWKEGMAWRVQAMAALLGVAMAHNRTLVPLPRSFPAATGKACS
ncbi:unnamed protein product, partial [Closterium sp. Naga37s-1]